MSQGNEVYCPFCSGPAAENCYGEHLLDPANTPPSPELAEALYTSISTLIFSSSLVAEEDPNPNGKDICLGGLTETQFPAEMDEVLQFSETNPSFYQSLSQESQCSAAEHENSQSYSLLPVYITRRRRRSKSDPSGTAVATEKHIAQITEIQARAWQALREIERAKNTLWLPRAQHDLWDEAITLGRERVRIYERKKTQGTLRLKLAKEFLSRLEELDARVQIGLIKATF